MAVDVECGRGVGMAEAAGNGSHRYASGKHAGRRERLTPVPLGGDGQALDWDAS